MHSSNSDSIRPGIKLSPALGTLVDDALAKVSAIGPIEAMKWLANAVHDASTAQRADARTVELPEGYAAVLVPVGTAAPTPDYDECARQADLATGIECPDRSWLSIFIREINRWCTHRQAETNEALHATARHTFRMKLGDDAVYSSRCILCEVWEGGAESTSPCTGVSLKIRASRTVEPRLGTEYPVPVFLKRPA